MGNAYTQECSTQAADCGRQINSELQVNLPCLPDEAKPSIPKAALPPSTYQTAEVPSSPGHNANTGGHAALENTGHSDSRGGLGIESIQPTSRDNASPGFDPIYHPDEHGGAAMGPVESHSATAKAPANEPSHGWDDRGNPPDDSFPDPSGRSRVTSYFDLELAERPKNLLQSGNELERHSHRFRSGATYDGEWLHGVRHGIGIQTWPDKTEYVGFWERGRAHGRGHMKHSDGDTYTGEWVNGRAHGYGTYRFQGTAAVYEGEFACDQREGLGVERWVDGSSYRGEFRKGHKYGVGLNQWPDGTQYLGRWRNNELYGAGRFCATDGPTYEGQWENSTPHGTGKYTYVDGSSYQGQYKFDKRHGFGVFTEDEGEEWKGFWVRGDFRS